MFDWFVAYLNTTDGMFSLVWGFIICQDCINERKYRTVVEKCETLERRIGQVEYQIKSLSARK